MARVLSSHEVLRIGLVRIFVAGGLWLNLIVRWLAEHGEYEKRRAIRTRQWPPTKDETKIARRARFAEEARMLTTASAARSFSDFLAKPIAAAADVSLRYRPAQSLEAPDYASYFDTIMRLSVRRPIPRRASRRI
jgi:hypothetical protein